MLSNKKEEKIEKLIHKRLLGHPVNRQENDVRVDSHKCKVQKGQNRCRSISQSQK